MTQATPNTYDEVSYPSYPFPQSHPDRLADLGHVVRHEACAGR